jgi:formylglycine-generating enzyme required for sulfatase activity
MARCRRGVILALVLGGCVRLGFSPQGPSSSSEDAFPSDGDLSQGEGLSSDAWGANDAGRADLTLDGPFAGEQSGPDGGTPQGTWIKIAAGTFTMGSPPGEKCRYANETQHPVTLTRGFELQSTEVTVGQFNAIMGYNPAAFHASGACASDSCPVETVSWHESAAYCNALSQLTGRPKCYSCAGAGITSSCAPAQAYSDDKIFSCGGYRLPTEAEWEYAYRAKTTTALYNGELTTCQNAADPKASQIAWYKQNASGRTHPVAQLNPNPWKLYDMAGNVWEWCHDRSTTNEGPPDLGPQQATDPWGASSGAYRVLRSGTWYWHAETLRAANRYSRNASEKYDSIGFRCLRTLP